MTSPPHNTYATFPSSGSLPQYGLLSIFLAITSSFTTRCFPFSWQSRHLSRHVAFHFHGKHVIFHDTLLSILLAITSSFMIRCFPFYWQSRHLSRHAALHFHGDHVIFHDTLLSIFMAKSRDLLRYAAFHFHGNHVIFHNTLLSIFMAITPSFTIRSFPFSWQSCHLSQYALFYSLGNHVRRLL